jgi:hypothetical protein
VHLVVDLEQLPLAVAELAEARDTKSFADGWSCRRERTEIEVPALVATRLSSARAKVVILDAPIERT